ncbi:unnamed protein product [Rotaria sp. Silwood1]|nr:unnamed protein product [Rotaria sp. Silwood1]CAF3354930.1 unnamed protein product [Rotaria sp. Silwood1]CAF3420630.1 unnamed protein product [Rotaria sp. Silwood1]CAF4530578.1 unnamed protein product [Rotaria sp. Silwood1]CAF4626644.1 unnamed protein product [Rotaria sp. Silwood1]
MSTIAYIFVVFSTVIIANTELVCPGYGFVFPKPPCIAKCSPTKDHCRAGKKCCYTPLRPCGYRCLVGKDNVAKNGTCPPPSSNQTNSKWDLCDFHDCDVDNDCQYDDKCCLNKCGASMCISPQ